MNAFFHKRLITLVALGSFFPPASALVGGGVADSLVDPVTRQVEQKAGRLVQRAMERRLEEQVSTRVREQLAELPPVLSVQTRKGRQAFNDVMLKDGTRAVERQWLVTGTASEIARLEQPGITVLERRKLSGLGMIVARFRVSDQLNSREALESVLPGLSSRLDRNHIYSPQTGASKTDPGVGRPQWQSLCQAPVRVGMVDTAIDIDHPVFQHAKITQKHFLTLAESNERLRETTDHGSAVASLMVGQSPGQWPARLPEADVYNASVFYNRQQGLSGATLGHLLEGLNWLAGQNLSVINISLAGPDNRLLKAAVAAMNEQSIALVAAVGNEGPASSPLYPAAYSSVIGVTAVDSQGQLYRWANRGEQVMFAAPGVGLPVAHGKDGMKIDDGTSLAAPIITAALACQRVDSSSQTAIEALINMATDLGDPGRDPGYGHGFLDL